MKKLLLLFVLVGINYCVSAQVIRDPNVSLRSAKNFHALDVSNSFTIYLTQSDEEMLAVSGETAEATEGIRAEVRNGTLFISYAGKGGAITKNLKAYISFKQLETINASGNCDIDIVGEWKAGDVAFHLVGASDMKGTIVANTLSINLTGASDLNLKGKAAQLSLRMSGATKFKGNELITDYCELKASGASDVKIYVNKEMSGQASGASEVRYAGEGIIRDFKTTGVSSISKIKS